jgi:hypothetical protein
LGFSPGCFGCRFAGLGSGDYLSDSQAGDFGNSALGFCVHHPADDFLMLKKVAYTIGFAFIALFGLHMLNQGAVQRTKSGFYLDNDSVNRAIGKSLTPFDQSFRELSPNRRK